jgi:pimeloyl-ACP methyl ester carboxylesterase
MSDFALPETHYALSGELNIAYQVMGDGPIDLVLVPGLISHVEFLHELPGYTPALRRLSRFARVVTFDKRGQGLSDRVLGVPSLEQRMDDVRAVMDLIGSARAILIGFSEGAAMSILFAATYPERVTPSGQKMPRSRTWDSTHPCAPWYYVVDDSERRWTEGSRRSHATMLR